MGAITVSNLGKAYKHYPNKWMRLKEWFSPSKKQFHQLTWVLQDINFTIQSGESIGIVGVNGAGKSTLLKMLTGTTIPTTGNVHIHGKVAALLELGLGFHPDFTGRQNVYMAGQLLGIETEQLTACMSEIESFAEIGGYIDHPVRTYSSGMQIRLAFSVATAIRPDILIVDEALSVGDAYFQAKCYQRINEFREQGTTLLLVSHSAGDVVKHCERAIMLKNGRIEMDGNSRDVTNCYLDELFGKSSVSKKRESLGVSLIEHTLSTEFNDEFNTRPGYRAEEYRWGNGDASILDYLVVSGGQEFPSHIDGNSEVHFYFKVHFSTDVENVVPGILIKTIEGIFLYGTNSFLATSGREVISAKVGDIRIFQFSMPLTLIEGNYLLSFGISSGDPLNELIPLDRRYDAVLINIGKTQEFSGMVDLKATFSCM